MGQRAKSLADCVGVLHKIYGYLATAGDENGGRMHGTRRRAFCALILVRTHLSAGQRCGETRHQRVQRTVGASLSQHTRKQHHQHPNRKQHRTTARIQTIIQSRFPTHARTHTLTFAACTPYVYASWQCVSASQKFIDFQLSRIVLSGVCSHGCVTKSPPPPAPV